MVKLFHHVLFSSVLEQVNDQEMRDGKSNHSSNRGLKVDLYISFFGRQPFPLDFRIIFLYQ